MMRFYRTLGLVQLILLSLAGHAADRQSFDQVVPERIGEFVTVAGSVKEFHYPPEPRAPFAFTLQDETSRTMRVVAWPDIYERIDGHELLKQLGTSVTLTAEVAEYKEKLELHLQDWEEITVEAADADPTATVGEDAATTNSSWRGGELTTGVAETAPMQPDGESTTGTVEP